MFPRMSWRRRQTERWRIEIKKFDDNEIKHSDERFHKHIITNTVDDDPDGYQWYLVSEERAAIHGSWSHKALLRPITREAQRCPKCKKKFFRLYEPLRCSDHEGEEPLYQSSDCVRYLLPEMDESDKKSFHKLIFLTQKAHRNAVYYNGEDETEEPGVILDRKSA
jgi:hypothetical protein